MQFGRAVALVRCGDITNDGADALFTVFSGGTAGDTNFGVLRGGSRALVLYRQGYKIGIARRNRRSFAVIQPHYRKNDANCCPSLPCPPLHVDGRAPVKRRQGPEAQDRAAALLRLGGAGSRSAQKRSTTRFEPGRELLAAVVARQLVEHPAEHRARLALGGNTPIAIRRRVSTRSTPATTGPTPPGWQATLRSISSLISASSYVAPRAVRAAACRRWRASGRSSGGSARPGHARPPARATAPARGLPRRPGYPAARRAPRPGARRRSARSGFSRVLARSGGTR